MTSYGRTGVRRRDWWRRDLDLVTPPATELDIAGFSFGGIIGGLVAARLGRRVPTLVLLGPGGMALPHSPPPPLLPIQSDAALEEIQFGHRENLRRLMINVFCGLIVYCHQSKKPSFHCGVLPALPLA